MTAAALKLESRLYKRGEIDYASIDAVNFSTLKWFAKSALHYRAACDGDLAGASDRMQLGAAAHVAVLEPVRFTRDFAVYAPPEGKSDRRGTKAWDEFVAANPGKEILKEETFNEALHVRDRVRGYAPAMRYLRKGDAEITAVWQDPETGIWCKCRLDFLSASVADCVVELKTSGTIDPWTFQATYARQHYHAQAAMQCDALEAITGRPHYHKCIAVEAKAPNDVAVYNVIGAPLEVGQELYRTWLRELAECRAKDEWPGIAHGAEIELALPKYALPDSDNDLSDIGLEMES